MCSCPTASTTGPTCGRCANGGYTTVVGCTKCGVLDADIPLDTVIVFDDLYFPVNRLADGSICSFYTEEATRAGHWIYEEAVLDRAAGCVISAASGAACTPAMATAMATRRPAQFNTRTEIRPA